MIVHGSAQFDKRNTILIIFSCSRNMTVYVNDFLTRSVTSVEWVFSRENSIEREEGPSGIGTLTNVWQNSHIFFKSRQSKYAVHTKGHGSRFLHH